MYSMLMVILVEEFHGFFKIVLMLVVRCSLKIIIDNFGIRNLNWHKEFLPKMNKLYSK